MKKSVLGRRCRLGASCKIVNSVIHDGAPQKRPTSLTRSAGCWQPAHAALLGQARRLCTAPSAVRCGSLTDHGRRAACADVVIEEGCSISGSIVGKGAVLQARTLFPLAIRCLLRRVLSAARTFPR